MQQIFISSYFQQDDYEKPVHYFMDDSFVSLRPNNCIVDQVFYKKSTLKLNDNIFGLFNTAVNDYFYSYSSHEMFLSDTVYGPGPGLYFQQQFMIDKQEDQYDR